MTRRSIFKLIAGAACAAVIELTGVRPAMPVVAGFNPAFNGSSFSVVGIFERCADGTVRIKSIDQTP